MFTHTELVNQVRTESNMTNLLIHRVDHLWSANACLNHPGGAEASAGPEEDVIVKLTRAVFVMLTAVSISLVRSFKPRTEKRYCLR